MNNYFPWLTKSAEWIVLPLNFTDKVNKLGLTYNEKNEFIDICSSSTIQILFNSKKKNMDFFW